MLKGIVVGREEGAVAVGYVVGAYVAHVLRQVDQAEAAVHPAVLVLPADLEAVVPLLQHAQGRAGGDGAQGLLQLLVPAEIQINHRPDGGVFGGDLRAEGHLAGLHGLRGAHGRHPVAVVGAGAEQARLIAQLPPVLHPGQGLPALVRRGPLLDLVIVALGLIPFQRVQPLPQVSALQGEHVAHQGRPVHGDGLGVGAAEDVPLPLVGGPDREPDQLILAGHLQIPALAEPDNRLVPVDPADGGIDPVLHSGDLVAPRAVPAQVEIPLGAGPPLQGGLDQVPGLDRHLNGLTADQLPVHAQQVFPPGHGLDADGELPAQRVTLQGCLVFTEVAQGLECLLPRPAQGHPAGGPARRRRPGQQYAAVLPRRDQDIPLPHLGQGSAGSDEIRRQQPGRRQQCQYQQHPPPAGGLLFDLFQIRIPPGCICRAAGLTGLFRPPAPGAAAGSSIGFPAGGRGAERPPEKRKPAV